MRIVGIIAEYNPFHKGHQYHMEQAKKIVGAEAAVVVMSGPVTQRGEAAICDKWSRAEMAVKCGADLVIELPYAFACNSAEEFARGGVSILNSLGCITDLVFGCESEPESIISMAIASVQYEAEFNDSIRTGLSEGLSYPKARSQAMMKFHPQGATASLDRPNDILAAEYVRQLLLQDSGIYPQGLIRRGTYHDPEVLESENTFSSATAVRKALIQGHWSDVKLAVPEESLELLLKLHDLEELAIHSGTPSSMDTMILSRIWSLGPEGLRSIHGCSEGLEYRIWNALPKVTTVDELLEEASSGRYPSARLRRLLMHALVGLTKERYEGIKTAANKGELYVRVLGCNETGAKILKQIKKTKEDIPVYTNLNRELSDDVKKVVKGEVTRNAERCFSAAEISLMLDVRAADGCRMGSGKRLYDGSDFVKGPYIAHKSEKNHK